VTSKRKRPERELRHQGDKQGKLVQGELGSLGWCYASYSLLYLRERLGNQSPKVGGDSREECRLIPEII
jgi:hypothetical protein